VASLNAPAAFTATTNVNVELPDDGTTRDLGLELRSDLRFVDVAAAMRANVWQRRLKSFIDMVRRRGKTMAMTAMRSPGFSPRFLGLGLGRPFGEGSRLAFGLPAELLQFRQRLVPFTLEALVLLLEAFVLAKKSGDASAEVGQFRKDECRNLHRITDLDLHHG